MDQRIEDQGLLLKGLASGLGNIPSPVQSQFQTQTLDQHSHLPRSGRMLAMWLWPTRGSKESPASTSSGCSDRQQVALRPLCLGRV